VSAGTVDPLDLLSVRELAKLWTVHQETIRKWIASGELASVQLGRRRLVPRVAAEEFIRQHMNGEGPADGLR
jgi:excisionase family DNA binding protein